MPKETKNKVPKKSLNDFTLAIISRLYSKLAKAKPAIKPPIAMENPNNGESKAKMNMVVSESKNNNSGVFAANLNKEGNNSFAKTTATTNRSNPFPRAINNNSGVKLLKVPNTEMAKTTTMSCINNIPITILPCRVSISLLSERILTTTKVEEKTSINATYTPGRYGKPRYKAKTIPKEKSKKICNKPPTDAIRPMDLILFRSSSNPTKNSMKAMPISPNNRMVSTSVIIPKTVGPITNPAIRYAGIIGCLRILANKAPRVATTMTMVRSTNMPFSITVERDFGIRF